MSRVYAARARPRAAGYAYYKAGLAGQWPVFRVLSAIGRRMARQRWPMAEDPRLFTLALVGACREKYRNKELYALLFVMSFVMLCNDYKPLQGVVSSGSKPGNQRALGVIISGLSLA